MNTRGQFLKRNFGLLVGGFALAAGLLCSWSAFSMFQSERRFDSDAMHAEGTVLQRDKRTTRRLGGSASSGTKNEYWVRYGFRDAAGVWREGDSRVDLYAWNSLADGGPVTVAYLPADPGTSRVAGKEEWLGTLVMAGLAAFALLFGGVITSVFLRRRRTRA